MRDLLHISVALAIGWSSVVDNPAVCADDDASGPVSTSRPCSDDGAPAVPCASCPCHLPSLRVTPGISVEPLFGIERPRALWPEQDVSVRDALPPPTPPPLARVAV